MERFNIWAVIPGAGVAVIGSVWARSLTYAMRAVNRICKDTEIIWVKVP